MNFFEPQAVEASKAVFFLLTGAGIFAVICLVIGALSKSNSSDK